jgi:nucleoside-diphosphate-sugar epimerase
MHAIVTGATGLLGRHLVKELCQRGWSVTAVVRQGSNRQPLEQLGVACAICDLSRENLNPCVLEKADVVFHAAGAVSDWAPWSYFTANTIRPTEAVCDTMTAAGCRRLIHFSTVGVYGRPPRQTAVSEDFPLAVTDRRNFYRRSKIESERIVWQHQREKQLAVTVIRPGMLYGPGDRSLLGRVVPLLRQQKISFLGDPRVALPLVHAGDVARAAVLAAGSDAAIGQAYNVINPEAVTQEEFFNTIAILAGAPHVRRHVPYSVAYTIAGVAELLARLLRSPKPPRLTRYRVFLFGYERHYSIEKIRSALGWEPQIGFRSGIQKAVQWQLSTDRSS